MTDHAAGPATGGGGPARDDTGTPVRVPERVRRVVSLVPSLTETVADAAPGLLAGATDWCTHPEGLDVPRVRGTKNPDLERIAELRPDVVVGNTEENRPADVEALRAAGVPVWMTEIRGVGEALRSLRRMLAEACRVPEPAWLDEADRAWAGAAPVWADGPRAAVVPVWRRPWMVVGRGTFTGDVLARLGVANVYAGHPERYPKIPLDELNAAGADLAVLPDEPYRFTAADGPEAFPGLDAALVDGRYLTWYGPSLVDAPAVLSRQLAAARRHRDA
ncbi:ABC transporter substrate-binding protein [Actinomadura graeca]|uniref:ABC transporter substrate-binding protein n=1 Tax=Actinomadura graeca TaxID=2750812 RepID=A0ABX8QMH3_9ACTN|nr:helical backbone metal receptor [Actinomadura graeca]QXJ19930.1 ABC transporter substrate-binding protein [Actinomadura graeca]